MRRLIAVAALGALAACSGGSDTVVVSAASSLADAFEEIESAFEAEHDGLDVILNVAGSSSLREQILEGAAVDVFASADQSNVDVLAEAGLINGNGIVLARNRMTIAVPSGNPGAITGLADFGEDEHIIGLCAEGVPCGDLARHILTNVGVEPAIDTDEPNARSLVTKIFDGEVDAGLVYITDVAATGVMGIAIPGDVDADVEYVIATLGEATNPQGAERFVDFVLSEQGRMILARHGFTVP